MTGVNKLSSCVAAFFCCGSAVAASPTGSFDQWSIAGGTTIPTATSTCPVGFSCDTTTNGDGFYQRQITNTSDNDFFQTIITDKAATSPPQPLTFSDEPYVQTGITTGLADKTKMIESTGDSEAGIKAVWVGQDMSTADGVAQEFGYSSYEDLATGTTNTFSLVGDTIDSACYSTPTGTDSSSGFVPTYGLQMSSFSANAITSIDIQADITPPTVTAPVNITTIVNGHANFFDLDPSNGGVLPEVSDDQTESFDFSSSNNVVIGPLAPGRHSLTWQAKDNAGNEGSAEQQIDILPTVNFTVDQMTAEGKNVTVTAYLNGPAPEYPVLIPYTVSGTATSGSYVEIGVMEPSSADHNAIDGLITINSGTIGQTSFDVIADNFSSGTTEEDETVIFTMGTPSNAVAGQKTQHTVTISDTPQTLTLDFLIAQNDQITPLVTTDNGVIRISAIPRNQNSWGFPTYDWSQSNNSLVSADCSQGSFYVDPSNLSPGLYRIHVTATDPVLADQPSSAEWWLRIGTAPTLSETDDSDGDGIDDSSEGYQDDDNDGIPNHLDVVEPTHLIPGFWQGNYKSLTGKTINNQHEPANGEVGWSVTGTKEHINYPMLIAIEPGLKLGAGSVHLWNYEHTQNVAIDWDSFSQFGQAFGMTPSLTTQINGQDIYIYNEADLDDLANLIDPSFDPEDPIQNDGNQFMVSLEISYLAKAGDSAKLVIPQTSAAFAREGYNWAVRNYNPDFGWKNMLEDHNNQITSALREGDYCPPAGANQYQTGLIEGFECLQLSLEDGGPNDADGYRNGRISFNGGVLPIIETEPEITTETENSSESLAATDASELDSASKDNSGGGAISPLLLTLLLLRRRHQRC